MIQPISFVTFQGKNPDLKRLWDKGKLPTVKYGIYGDLLTHETISREHLLPKSYGGTKKPSNIALSSKIKNNARGNDDITKYADPKIIKQYLDQFKDVDLKELNGKKYILGILSTLRRLGVPI